MSSPAIKGRSRDILERVYVWVDAALNFYYDDYYITTNWKENVSRGRIFPAVSVRVDPVLVEDEVFGRYLPNIGSTVEYEFSIHAFEKYNERDDDDTEDYNEDAQLLAVRIMGWLKRKNGSATENTDHGIRNVLDVGARESDPNILDVARLIIEGVVVAKRIDSP